MDEMKLRLSTKFMKGIVERFIKKVIFKKCGIRPDITLNEISIEMSDGKVHFRINADG